MKRTHHRKNRFGASTVEFALVLPLFLTLLFATFEIGRLNMMSHAAESAAYEGCRVGIVPNATSAECVDATENVLNGIGVSGANVQVQPTSEAIAVTVSFRYRDNAAIPFIIPKSTVVTRRCVLTRELQ